MAREIPCSPGNKSADGARQYKCFDQALFFRPACNLGDSQRSTRPIKPGTNSELTWPCGSHQISGCCHFCQRSSIGCLSVNKLWIPSINNTFSFGMIGV